MRGANQITDAEFLTAYNNAELTNQQVIDTLDTDWTAIGVKLRSERLKKHLTVELRTGGKGGPAPRALSDAELTDEAKAWRANGTIAEKPGVGKTYSDASASPAPAPQVSSAPAPTEAATPTTSGNIGTAAPTPAPAIQTAPAAAPQPAPAATSPNAVRFTASIFGETHTFQGATMVAARDSLVQKLIEKNISKMMMEDRSGRAVGLGEIANGGHYVIKRQLTAAFVDGIIYRTFIID